MRKVSTPSQIVAFNPAPHSVVATPRDLKGETPEEVVASTLAQGHPKSRPVEIHKGMEGPRTGIPHITPHSLRYRGAHERVGTKLEPDKRMI